jgi:hypothetical protein
LRVPDTLTRRRAGLALIHIRHRNLEQAGAVHADHRIAPTLVSRLLTPPLLKRIRELRNYRLTSDEAKETAKARAERQWTTDYTAGARRSPTSARVSLPMMVATSIMMEHPARSGT